MSIPVLNSQGTKIYVADDQSASWTDCPTAVGAIKGGHEVGCPQSIGALEETRNVTEYKCMSSNETAKALGSISRGNIEIGLLFDPDDTEGQEFLRQAWNDNKNVAVGIELPDMPEGTGTGGNGTFFWFVGGVSAVSTGIVQDEAVTYTVTLEIASDISLCPKKAPSTQSSQPKGR